MVASKVRRKRERETGKENTEEEEEIKRRQLKVVNSSISINIENVINAATQ